MDTLPSTQIFTNRLARIIRALHGILLHCTAHHQVTLTYGSLTLAIFPSRAIFMGLKRYILVINFIHILEHCNSQKSLLNRKIAHFNVSDFF